MYVFYSLLYIFRYFFLYLFIYLFVLYHCTGVSQRPAEGGAGSSPALRASAFSPILSLGS